MSISSLSSKDSIYTDDDFIDDCWKPEEDEFFESPVTTEGTSRTAENVIKNSNHSSPTNSNPYRFAETEDVHEGRNIILSSIGIPVGFLSSWAGAIGLAGLIAIGSGWGIAFLIAGIILLAIGIYCFKKLEI